MRRAENFGLGVMAGAAALQVGLAHAASAAEVVAEGVAEPVRGGSLLVFGVATLVPALAVYAFFRRRELRGVPEAAARPTKRKDKPAKLKRLPKVKANPVALALEAKVVAVAAPPARAVTTPPPPAEPEDAAQQPA